MVGLDPSRLIRVKRHRDDRAIPRTGGDDGAETLRTHDPYRGTTATRGEVSPEPLLLRR
jgi:hypothetical protein